MFVYFFVWNDQHKWLGWDVGLDQPMVLFVGKDFCGVGLDQPMVLFVGKDFCGNS